MVYTTLIGLPHPEPFTGEGIEPFSHWLRRFNDHAEAHEKPWTDSDKLRKLKAYLRGRPREKWDEFTDTEKAAFAAATTKLKSVYENSFSKDIAKLNLARCHQRAGESINDFVEREFLDHLDDEVGFHVKAIMPQNMEEAVCQDMRFEGLLEARKMNSLSGHRDEPPRPLARRIQCRNCVEWDHIRRDCHIHDQGCYDKRSYDDCQRSNNTYYGDDGYNGRYDSGYVSRYGLEGARQYRNYERYSREQFYDDEGSILRNSSSYGTKDWCRSEKTIAYVAAGTASTPC
ncbi:Protein DCT-10 [Aphelenchoides avenae]|nr:Protein DCT-10 [Aphelenchus avenae]